MDHGVDQTVAKSKKRKIVADRVSLKPASVAKLDQWLTQIQETMRGVQLSRTDILDWLISENEEVLSAAQLKSLGDRHFDELKFALWAVAELKRAREHGESRSLADILQESRVSKGEPASRIRTKKKATETVEKDSLGPEKLASVHSDFQQKTLENQG